MNATFSQIFSSTFLKFFSGQNVGVSLIIRTCYLVGLDAIFPKGSSDKVPVSRYSCIVHQYTKISQMEVQKPLELVKS